MANWRVSTINKKSVTEVEIYYKDKMELRRLTGFRWGTFVVTTEDDNPPEFDDPVDMYSPGYESELVDLDDGCWSDIEWPVNMPEEERERLEARMDEEGFYILEDEEGWSLDECECWFEGPLEIEKEEA